MKFNKKMNKIIMFMMLVSTLFMSGCTAVSVIDPNTQFTIKDYLNENNENGNVFETFYYNPNLNSGDNESILIQTNGRAVFLLQYGISIENSPQDLLIYEGVTVSNTGTPLNTHNKNRANNKNATTLVYASPTITKLGTLIQRDYLAGKSKEGIQTKDIETPFILARNTTYLIMAVNNANQAEEILFNIEFKENDRLFE